MEDYNYKPGQKIVFIPDGKIYDFGYIGGTGMAVIYEEGECNIQDSCATDFKNIKPLETE